MENARIEPAADRLTRHELAVRVECTVERGRLRSEDTTCSDCEYVVRTAIPLARIVNTWYGQRYHLLGLWIRGTDNDTTCSDCEYVRGTAINDGPLSFR